MQKQSEARTAIIGCGTMGRAIATGLVRAHVVELTTLILADRSPGVAESLARDLGAPNATRGDTATAASEAQVVLLCVKPGDVAPALTQVVERRALQHRPLLISIAAGVNTHAIESVIGPTVP